MTPSEKRASLILQVRAGQITAQEAAHQLGISRQAFYKWEKRGLAALLNALADPPAGHGVAPGSAGPGGSTAGGASWSQEERADRAGECERKDPTARARSTAQRRHHGPLCGTV